MYVAKELEPYEQTMVESICQYADVASVDDEVHHVAFMCVKSMNLEP